MEIFDPEKPYDLDKRIKAFVLEIFEFIEILPNTAAGRNVKNQLVRCASSEHVWRPGLKAKRVNFLMRRGVFLKSVPVGTVKKSNEVSSKK